MACSNRIAARILREARGNVTTASKALGLKRSTLAMRIAANPRLKAIVDESRESVVDEVENVFVDNCLDPAPQYVTARIFFLKTQAKHRGYVEKSEVELSGPGGGPVITEIVIEHQAVQTIRTDAEYIDDRPTSAPAIADSPDEPVPSAPDAGDPSIGTPTIS